METDIREIDGVRYLVINHGATIEAYDLTGDEEPDLDDANAVYAYICERDTQDAIALAADLGLAQ